jgi:dihydroorotase
MSDSVKLNNGEAVTVGLIDFHTHVFENSGPPGFNLNPDRIGIDRGISTVVDQGGAGALALAEFKHNIVEKSQTHVQCFVSAYLVGGNPRGEIRNLYGPQGMDADKTIQTVQQVDPTLQFVRGVKAHCGPSGYDDWGIQPLKIAVEIASALKLPVYVHLGSLWNFEPSATHPSAIVDQVLDIVRPGDMLAHPYRPNNGFVTDGQVHTAVKELKQKGVLFDVGRGTNFSFSNARLLLEQGMQPDIISSDLHGFSKPDQNSLFNSMSEMLHLGMSLEDIIKAVSVTPQRYLKNCSSGNQIRLVEKTKTFEDSCGESIVVNQVFESCQTL